MIIKNLKNLREKMELTQKELAEQTNVDRSTYASWEIGKDTIPLRNLIRICNFYEVSLDYITGLSEKNNYHFIDPNIDSTIVGQNLKKFRNKLNLKQCDIYKILNTTSSTYSAYENGKVLIQMSFIYIIGLKFNVSIDELLKKQN